MRKAAARPRISQNIQLLSSALRMALAASGGSVEKSARAPVPPLLVREAMRILVTGGCGFIGSNFIRYILKHYKPAYVTNVDVLTYAGNLANLDGLAETHGDRYEFFKADIANADQMDELMTEHQFYTIINFAAESHVDRSINSPLNFIHTNVIGTSVLLDCARRHGVQRFIQISTDEVYGSLGATGKFTEQSPLDPSSPYSSSKAGADLLALASYKTYGQEVIVTRCSNNYGPYQFPEKLIPLMIIKAMRDEPLPVYGDGKNVRDWIHVDDHCAAVVGSGPRGVEITSHSQGGGTNNTKTTTGDLHLLVINEQHVSIGYGGAVGDRDRLIISAARGRW